MKLLFIFPRWSGRNLWGHMGPSIHPGLITLARITPERHEVRIVDENSEPVPFDDDFDLVCITVLTPLAPRAYALAGAFRERGRRVVLGGVHPFWHPEEAAEHADCVVQGEAEELWDGLLTDAEEGRLRPRYKAASVPSDWGVRRWKRKGILAPEKGFSMVQMTRGCPFRCSFCSVTAMFGGSYRSRDPEEVLEEVDLAGGRQVFFTDDTLLADRERTMRLLRGLRDRDLNWTAPVRTDAAEDGEFLELARDSGCLGFLIGFESLSESSLRTVGKAGAVHRYAECLRRVHDHGMGVLGAFIFGLDGDGEGVFDETLEFCTRNELDAGLFSVLTPLPGTGVHRRLEAEGRILDRDWSKYDMSTVVFRPKNMSPERLERGHAEFCRSFYSLDSIHARLRHLPRSAKKQIFRPMNICFARAWERLGS